MRYIEQERSEKTVVTKSGVSFTGLLTIVFVVLKLCNVIDWSWFWVLSPLIFSFGLIIIIFLFVLAITFSDN